MKPPTSSATERRPKDTGPGDPRSGFALIEVMLALVLIAMFAALALPRARPFDGSAALRTKAYEVAALLRADRDAARRMSREVASVVNFDRRRVSSGLKGAAVSFPDGVSMRLKADMFPGFRFFADGRSSGGELALVAGRRSLVLRVDRLTSAVEIRATGSGPQ